GSSVATWALFSKQGITLRSLILFNSFCWVSHNLWLGSIGGSLVESTFIVTNLLTIYRLFHAQERLSHTQNNQFLASNTESSTD
ncbi:YgjV family protein, partial [Vibrio parahaemolyticus]